MTKFLIVPFILFTAFCVEAQNWMEYTPEDSTQAKDSSTADSTHYQAVALKDTLRLVFSNQAVEAKKSEPRMVGELIELLGTPYSPDGVLLNGFRIQIHFGQDKNEANQKRAEFIARYDDIPVYLDYQAPNFRVRVGDFRNRLVAEKYKSELEAEYPGLIIVHDKIKLPPIPEDELEE